MTNSRLFLIGIMVIALAGLARGVAFANEMPVYKLVLKDGKFSPQAIEVPAGTKFRLMVTNEDAIPMEFESSDLNREHVITPGATWRAFIGPLDAGPYGYFNDFDRAIKGEIVAK